MESMNNSMKIVFVVKTSEDYPTWEFTMTAMLEAHGLLETVIPPKKPITVVDAEKEASLKSNGPDYGPQRQSGWSVESFEGWACREYVPRRCDVAG